jgi:hypothetical protein
MLVEDRLNNPAIVAKCTEGSVPTTNCSFDIEPSCGGRIALNVSSPKVNRKFAYTEDGSTIGGCDPCGEIHKMRNFTYNCIGLFSRIKFISLMFFNI